MESPGCYPIFIIHGSFDRTRPPLNEVQIYFLSLTHFDHYDVICGLMTSHDPYIGKKAKIALNPLIKLAQEPSRYQNNRIDIVYRIQPLIMTYDDIMTSL